jgi:DNA-binding transcriptional ArsR family regulator
MTTYPPPPATLEVTAVLHALADPVRLELIRQLSASDTEVACGRFDSPVAKSTLSHHFRILREAGVIVTRRERGQSLNALRTAELETSFPGLLHAVLSRPRQ